MLRGFSASLAAVFTYSQHVSAFTLPHLKHVTCSKYAPSCSGPRASASHCCSSGTLGFDRACTHGHVLPGPPGVTPGPHQTPCGTSSGTSAPASLCCLFTLGYSGTLHYLQQHFVTCPPAVGYAISSWVLGSQSLAVSLSSRAFGTCFIHHIQ